MADQELPSCDDSAAQRHSICHVHEGVGECAATQGIDGLGAGRLHGSPRPQVTDTIQSPCTRRMNGIERCKHMYVKSCTSCICVLELAFQIASFTTRRCRRSRLVRGHSSMDIGHSYDWDETYAEVRRFASTPKGYPGCGGTVATP
jgi:hypothetical protein